MKYLKHTLHSNLPVLTCLFSCLFSRLFSRLFSCLFSCLFSRLFSCLLSCLLSCLFSCLILFLLVFYWSPLVDMRPMMGISITLNQLAQFRITMPFAFFILHGATMTGTFPSLSFSSNQVSSLLFHLTLCILLYPHRHVIVVVVWNLLNSVVSDRYTPLLSSLTPLNSTQLTWLAH